MNVSDTDQGSNDHIDQPQADSRPHTDSPPHADSPPHSDWQPQTDSQPRYDYRAGDEPLYRPLEGRMVAGVAAGIAQYLGVDVTVVRIVLAVLIVVGGAGVPVYAAGWLLIPDEGASQSVASQLINSLQSRTN
jgi:phage shock protein C